MSALDDVPGLGPARRAALLRHFGSVRKLRAASAEEIAAVRGIGPEAGGVPSPTALGRNGGNRHADRVRRGT